MKIVIIAQEEPVYFGPFLRAVIAARAQDVVLVAIIGHRGAGSHPKTFWKKIVNLYSLWRLLEPAGFLGHLAIRCYQKGLAIFGWIGTQLDKRSVEGIAKRHNLDIQFISDVNDPSFLSVLKRIDPDVVINQSELLLKQELLLIPKIGVLNRHASLLPHFRGRLASFWGHASEPPEYGVTIHFVHEEIDSGPIVVQKKFDLDPRISYAKTLEILFQASVPLMLEALEKIAQPSFSPLPNHYQGTPVSRFPTLGQIQNYREVLRERRAVRKEASPRSPASSNVSRDTEAEVK